MIPFSDVPVPQGYALSLHTLGAAHLRLVLTNTESWERMGGVFHQSVLDDLHGWMFAIERLLEKEASPDARTRSELAE